jgi:hypothetical protein
MHACTVKCQRLNTLRKNSQYVIPKGWFGRRNLRFFPRFAGKQILRFAQDDTKIAFFCSG